MSNFIRLTKDEELLWGRIDKHDSSTSAIVASSIAAFKEARHTFKRELIPSCKHQECIERRTKTWNEKEKEVSTVFNSYFRSPSEDALNTLQRTTYLLTEFLEQAISVEIRVQVLEDLKEVRSQFGSVSEIIENVLQRLKVPEGAIRIALVAIPKEMGTGKVELDEWTLANLARVASGERYKN